MHSVVCWQPVATHQQRDVRGEFITDELAEPVQIMVFGICVHVVRIPGSHFGNNDSEKSPMCGNSTKYDWYFTSRQHVLNIGLGFPYQRFNML